LYRANKLGAGLRGCAKPCSDRLGLLGGEAPRTGTASVDLRPCPCPNNKGETQHIFLPFCFCILLGLYYRSGWCCHLLVLLKKYSSFPLSSFRAKIK
jgi:hypothetical protein